MRHRRTTLLYLIDLLHFAIETQKGGKSYLFAIWQYENLLRSVIFALKSLEISKKGPIFASSNKKKSFCLEQKNNLLMQGRTTKFGNERKATSALGSTLSPTSMIWKYYLVKKVTFAEGGLNYDVH